MLKITRKLRIRFDEGTEGLGLAQEGSDYCMHELYFGGDPYSVVDSG